MVWGKFSIAEVRRETEDKTFLNTTAKPRTTAKKKKKMLFGKLPTRDL